MKNYTECTDISVKYRFIATTSLLSNTKNKLKHSNNNPAKYQWQ